MKKSLVWLLIVVLTVSMIATVSLAVGEEVVFDWKRFEGKKINLLFNEHPWSDGVRENIGKFEELTGIKVNLETFSEELYYDKFKLAVYGKKPLADVVFSSPDYTGFTLWSDNKVASLSLYLDDPTMTPPDYDPQDFKGSIDANIFPDGQLYGIPITVETYILFYNKDLVDQYLDGKLPETFEELIAGAGEITEKGDGEVFGAVMRGIRSPTIMDTVCGVVLNSWGARPADLPYNVWFDGAWDKPRFSAPNVRDGIVNYVSLMKAGPSNIQVIDWYDATLLFSQGKIAFFIDASLFAPGFEDPETSEVAGKVGYAQIPPVSEESRSATWQWALSIPANSDNKEAAWYFVAWATSKEMEPKIGIKAAGAAPRLSTWDDMDYSAVLIPEYVEAVKKALATARSASVHSIEWSEVAIAIVDTMHDIYAGEDPVEATKALDQKVINIMK